MGPKTRRSQSKGSAEAPPALAEVLAEFDLRSTHCSIVPVHGSSAGHARPGGQVGELEVDGQRYRVMAKPVTPPPVPSPAERPEDPTRLLTSRELQIVRLVCCGQVNKQIAYHLRISEYTVKTYLKQIFMKLGVRSRSAMAFRCARWVGVPARAIEPEGFHV